MRSRGKAGSVARSLLAGGASIALGAGSGAAAPIVSDEEALRQGTRIVQLLDAGRFQEAEHPESTGRLDKARLERLGLGED